MRDSDYNRVITPEGPSNDETEEVGPGVSGLPPQSRGLQSAWLRLITAGATMEILDSSKHRGGQYRP